MGRYVWHTSNLVVLMRHPLLPPLFSLHPSTLKSKENTVAGRMSGWIWFFVPESWFLHIKVYEMTRQWYKASTLFGRWCVHPSFEERCLSVFYFFVQPSGASRQRRRKTRWHRDTIAAANCQHWPHTMVMVFYSQPLGESEAPNLWARPDQIRSGGRGKLWWGCTDHVCGFHERVNLQLFILFSPAVSRFQRADASKQGWNIIFLVAIWGSRHKGPLPRSVVSHGILVEICRPC